VRAARAQASLGSAGATRRHCSAAASSAALRARLPARCVQAARSAAATGGAPRTHASPGARARALPRSARGALVAHGNASHPRAALSAGIDLTAGNFTVFAPTDAAFAKLPAGTVDGLLKDKKRLSEILVRAASLRAPQPAHLGAQRSSAHAARASTRAPARRLWPQLGRAARVAPCDQAS